MNNELKTKVEDLIAYCHEHGFATVVGIADKNTGESVRAADGHIFDLLTLMSLLFLQFEEQSGADYRDMIDSVKDVARKAKKKTDSGKNKWEYEK